mmetsp:Transcript_16175/g.42424  ORF Transcript_16175/g.42424 Transcript_16175/m.42424 type:complete len:182 (-) Transcript_16175:211-756(-)
MQEVRRGFDMRARPHTESAQGVRRKGFCVHGRIQYQCTECGGKWFCEHNRKRYRCKKCKWPTSEGSGMGDARSMKGRALTEGIATSSLATIAAAAIGDDGGGVAASLAPTGEISDDSQVPDGHVERQWAARVYNKPKQPWPGVVFVSWENMREAGVPMPGTWKKLAVGHGHAVLYCGTQNT